MGRDGKEEWARRVARWRASGLSATEFASDTGLNAHTLRHWAWRLGRQRVARRPPDEKRDTEVTWLEVVPSEATAPTGRPPADWFEVVAGGRTLRIPPGFDEAALRRLLAVLEAR